MAESPERKRRKVTGNQVRALLGNVDEKADEIIKLLAPEDHIDLEDYEEYQRLHDRIAEKVRELNKQLKQKGRARTKFLSTLDDTLESASQLKSEFTILDSQATPESQRSLPLMDFNEATTSSQKEDSESQPSTISEEEVAKRGPPIRPLTEVSFYHI